MSENKIPKELLTKLNKTVNNEKYVKQILERLKDNENAIEQINYEINWYDAINRSKKASAEKDKNKK